MKNIFLIILLVLEIPFIIYANESNFKVKFIRSDGSVKYSNDLGLTWYENTLKNHIKTIKWIDKDNLVKISYDQGYTWQTINNQTFFNKTIFVEKNNKRRFSLDKGQTWFYMDDEYKDFKDKINNFQIFPNPVVSNTISISTVGYKDKNLLISFYNSKGLLLKKLFLNSDNTTISSAFLSNGIYFVKLKCRNKMAIKRIIVNK